MNTDIIEELRAGIEEFLAPHFSHFYLNEIDARPDEIEVYIKETCKEVSVTRVLRVTVSHIHREVHIPNIIMPFSVRKKGLGKGLIAKVYEISKQHRYQMFLVMMTESFFIRMKSRGAKVITEDDCVQITDRTDLMHRIRNKA